VLLLLVVFGVVAVAMPWIVRRLDRRGFLVAAAVPAAAFFYTVLQGPRVIAGETITESYRWIAELNFSIAVRLDTLSWTLALIVTGVGALILVYCTRYFRSNEAHLGRFAGVLLAFAGAMYGLVLADDVYLLFVFWEATSVLSYLLIGHSTARKTSRGAALQALLVTTFGGLVMLVGLVILAVSTGTSSLSRIIELAPVDGLTTVAVMLVLVGALSKSAIFPFHFWLPAAMVAPTPVSAYLHAAAMVKAGIYLIARLAPGFSDMPGWREVLVALGVVTMLLGGWVALKQHDLKLILAYGTVSQLGFLTVIVGFGTKEAAIAGLALVLAHALFKSTLFLVAGIVDHRAGTRDIRKLSGLGRSSRTLAVVTALALASMVGLPPFLGFVAKEGVFTALLTVAQSGSAVAWIALVGVALGSILTTAYSVRFFWGAFSTKEGVTPVKIGTKHPDFLISPMILAGFGLVLGLLAPVLDGWLAGYPASFPDSAGPTYSLALWHGLEPALFISAATLGLGGLMFVWRDDVTRLQRKLATGLSSANGYRAIVRTVDRAAARTTGLTQRGSLPFYLGVIFLVFAVTVTTGLILNRSWPSEIRLWDYPAQLSIGVVMVVAAIAATRVSKRFPAVVLVGVTGFGMAALFALQGAPDLALTQILVEVVTLVAFVLVLRRLPSRLGERTVNVRRIVRVIIAVSFGALMAVVAVVSLGARTALPISLEWADLAYLQAHGRNIVNVALVDLRGWDTMGELAVVIAAATGVASLIFISGRTDNLPRVNRRVARQAGNESLTKAIDPTSDERGSWLIAGRALVARNRSILLEVVVRLIFHALIVVSIYLLLAGHNAPGGGFAGGLVAGMALVARYLAGGRHELGAAAPFDAGKVLGTGLTLAVGTALVPLFFGVDALTSTWWQLNLGIFGQLDFVTSTIFDIGVYLVVIGLVLDVLRSLGAEVDRQQEQSEVSSS
jgi:multicomponent Na+:H+ antiporter subunit A